MQWLWHYMGRNVLLLPAKLRNYKQRIVLKSVANLSVNTAPIVVPRYQIVIGFYWRITEPTNRSVLRRPYPYSRGW